MTRGWGSREGRGPGASWPGSSSPSSLPSLSCLSSSSLGWESWAETAAAWGQPAEQQKRRKQEMRKLLRRRDARLTLCQVIFIRRERFRASEAPSDDFHRSPGSGIFIIFIINTCRTWRSFRRCRRRPAAVRSVRRVSDGEPWRSFVLLID